MVLVDVDTVKSQPQISAKTEDSLTNAINSLVSSNEFSRANYGSNAKTIADLDKEMKEILERDDLEPAYKLKFYDQKLQKFLLRESEKPSISTTPAPVPILQSPSQPSQAAIPSATSPSHSFGQFSSINEGPAASSSVLLETPKNTKIPFYSSGQKQHKTNLPRSTPIQERLRSVTKRQKNSRYQDYFSSWESHIEE